MAAGSVVMQDLIICKSSSTRKSRQCSWSAANGTAASRAVLIMLRQLKAYSIYVATLMEHWVRGTASKLMPSEKEW